MLAKQENISSVFSRYTYLPFSPNFVWKIESGIIASSTSLGNDKTVILGIWGIGDIVGQCISATIHYEALCLTGVVAKQLQLSEVENLADILLTHLKHAERLILFRAHNPETALMLFLDWMSKRFGNKFPERYMLQVNLTQEQIGMIIGLMRPTVSRALNKLEDKGLIKRYLGGRILLKNIVFEQALKNLY